MTTIFFKVEEVHFFFHPFCGSFRCFATRSIFILDLLVA